MKLKSAVKSAVLALAAVSSSPLHAQTNNYFGTSGAISGSVWSTNPSGPYTSALVTTGGAIINFGNAATFTGATIMVAGINVTENATLEAAVGTIGLTGIVEVNVANGKTLNLGLQTFTETIGRGLNKTGGGTLAIGATSDDLAGGFIMTAGTVVVLGINGLGNGALALNGGIVASDGNRDFGTRHDGGITIGGDLQLGATGGLASSTAGLTFGNDVGLEASTRTLTIGNNGAFSFGGVIGGGSGAGLTIAAFGGTTGSITLNGANSYSGATTISGGKLVLGAGGSMDQSTSIVVGSAGSSGASLDTAVKSTGFTILDSQTLSGIGTVNVGSGKILTIEGIHSVGNSGTNAGVGTQTVTGNLSYASDSIFNWDLNESSTTTGFDKVATSGSVTVSNSGTVFNVVLGTTARAGILDSGNVFWNTPQGTQSWSMASIFGQTIQPGSQFASVETSQDVSSYGSFTINGSSLTWTAVPEPTSALAGILLGTSLLRRRRAA
jgi:fibronectin-binding autotransporter adhesin